jgi:hypothetical protein
VVADADQLVRGGFANGWRAAIGQCLAERAEQWHRKLSTVDPGAGHEAHAGIVLVSPTAWAHPREAWAGLGFPS